MRNTMDAACAIEADGVVFHVGSHLGAGFEAGLERAVPALRSVLERCTDDDLAAARGLGRRRRHDRPLGRRARRASSTPLDAHERLGVCLDTCHLWVSGVDVTDRPSSTRRWPRWTS